MTLDSAALQSWAAQLLTSWGYREEDAAYIADTLVDANLRGVDSHGVIRLPAYYARIEAGLVAPAADPIVTREGGVIRVDAASAPGQLAARAAVEALVEASDELGVASAAVHGSTHFGTAGYYARALAARGKIGIVVSNSEPVVVPFGGKDAFLGTNPFAFAAPTSGDAISLDMATSTSAMGRVMVAQAQGSSIPGDWGVDADGHPTTDPNAVKALLPAGGPKGYGLAYLTEVLGGVLSGAAVASDIGNMYSDFSKPQNVGHWMLALDVERFLPFMQFIHRMDRLAADAHAIAPAPGFTSVLVPGEPEERNKTARLNHGIDLPPATIEELTTLGTSCGVPFLEGDIR